MQGFGGRVKTHTLYRFFDSNGALLYVGITLSPPQRFAQHRSSKWWWTRVACIELDSFPTRAAVLVAEQSAIESERPRYNVLHNEKDLEHLALAAAVDAVFDDHWWAVRDQVLERQADEYEFQPDDLDYWEAT